MRKGLKIGSRIRWIYFYRVQDERLFAPVAKKFSSMLQDKMLLKLRTWKYIGPRARGINPFLTSLRKNRSIFFSRRKSTGHFPPANYSTR